MNRAGIITRLLGAVMAALLVSCGSSDSSGGTGGTGITTSGVVTAYGSVVVNGVHYDETWASVSIDDLAGAGDHRGIKLGMTVKIRGRTFGAAAVATAVEAEHAVEGLVAGHNGADTLAVLGQTVIVDGQTLYEPPGTTFASLVPGSQVEVYGLRDQNNAVRATLIEVVDNSQFNEEVRGTISNLNTMAMTFEVNGFVISYDNATTYSDGGSLGALANGLTVEVHFNTGSTGNYATEIEFEDHEDSEFEAAEDSRLEIEGYISTIVNATTFVVAGQVVETNVNTVYQNGVASDIAVGRKIHAKGLVSGGLLVADRIEFD